MATQDPLKDLDLLVRSRYGLIFLETAEEERAEALLRHLADHLQIPLFTWNLTGGLRRADGHQPAYDTTKPLQALHHVELADIPALYHFSGLGVHLGDPATVQKLRDAAAKFRQRHGAIVITGDDASPPDSVRHIGATIRLPPPGADAYRELLRQVVRDVSARTSIDFELSFGELNQLVSALQGLTLLEAEKILTKAIIEDGKLSAADIRSVVDAKSEVVKREGLLEYYPVEQSMAEIADLAGLKGWLAKRKAILTDPQRAREFGLPFPKGVLLLGVPGCGKSLCAKAVAMEWGLPLLKLDPANLYNKYVGESERNFKRAMQTSEKLAPVVLWIDEIEKAFAAGGGEEAGGVSTRVLGTFLSWLQDRSGDVFVIATANDVSKLPPELLRKGRFDEIFFVDLPNEEARATVWEIHLRKRGQDPAGFNLPSLVTATEGFSGAEVEQVVVSALYTAFSTGSALSDAILRSEILSTRPLSHTMGERITALREWASERTVSAH